ncbi:sensor histidine kinase [Microtetraspora sp. NBRC 16547]|uniref:sensor histidine kinase n=1 Tax=Microtetraspora sp. NBRC 16547 TaxID=3030993 RepID=UPI0024A54BC4|nr:sensor histidine kinase [Microtetraspora sp. NBRC 16547]GLX01282.1 two-component sensor histidine kinase [Microtetraspora sp. NBRC 16547]
MFGRLRAWKRRHSLLVDTLALTPLVLLSLLSSVAMSGVPRGPELYGIGPVGALLLSALLLTPLIWRRKYPLAVFAIVALVCFVQWLAHIDILPSDMAVLAAMYTVAARRPLKWAIAAFVVTELGLFLAFVRQGDQALTAWPTSSVFVVAIWVTGIYVNMRQRYVESLLERAERAERETDQQARIAAAAERTRIARELHDVVAHNVSVMVVQADGAGYAIDTDPEQARRAVQAVSSTGRQALAEMRRLVGVLRDDRNSAGEYAPQPGLDQLTDLVEQVRASGLPVEFIVSGSPQDIREGEQLVIYRIIQEALTNTLKHGGPGVRASVLMEYGSHDVTLTVSDDGRGASAARSDDGHGLIGMRERVSMYGGTVSAAPRPGGGFRVTARLPIGQTA